MTQVQMQILDSKLETKGGNALKVNQDKQLLTAPQNIQIIETPNCALLPTDTVIMDDNPKETNFSIKKKIGIKNNPSENTNSTTNINKSLTGNLPDQIASVQEKGTITSFTGMQDPGSFQTHAQITDTTLNVTTKHNPSENSIPVSSNSVVQSGGKFVSKESSSSLAGTYISSSPAENVRASSFTSPSQVENPESQTRTLPRDISENILKNKSQEKRMPLLAVVKPNSQGKLVEIPHVTSPILQIICASEVNQSHSNLKNISATQNPTLIARKSLFRTPPSIQSSPVCQIPSHVPSQTCPEVSIATDPKTTIQLHSQARGSARCGAATPSTDFTNSETDANIMVEESQQSKSTNVMEGNNVLNIAPNSDTTQSASETVQSRATKVLESSTTDLTKESTATISSPNQSVGKPLAESDSVIQKSEPIEGKQKRKSTNDDFCFSDEEDESIPRAIGSQVDRIETFLKNERLRLSKKRKTADE